MVMKMSSEEVFDAWKNGFSTYGKFFKAVTKEIGMERALELHGSGYENYGPVFDEMFRTLSLEELGANIGGIFTSFGYNPKISQTSKSVLVTVHGCPDYEGFKEAGLDHETIKKLCLCSVASIDASLQKLGANGEFSINKYRSDSDDFCIHEFKKKK
ncbi:hypothetical protein ES703_82989 [subsurface metagenome]